MQARLNLQPASREAIECARDWLNSYQSVVGRELPAPGLGPIGTAEGFYQANLIWARLQIFLEHPTVVQSYLEQQLHYASEKRLPSREIELRLIQAQMHHQSGKEEAALNALEKALIISRRSGHIRVFIQNSVLDDLIHRAALKGVYLNDLQPILSAIRGVRSYMSELVASPPNRRALSDATMLDTLVDPLSERERRLIEWEQVPSARYCHPREEHLLPLHVCQGMANKPAKLIFDDLIMGKRGVAFLW